MVIDRGPEADVARVAAAIGDPARAAMLGALLGGVARTAGELARSAGVAPATASGHLARLLDGGLVTCRQSGRHRYYALADAEVAAALEALARVGGHAVGHPSRATASPRTRALRYARTCYDHLAGTLGVLLADTLVNRGFLAPHTFDVTAPGADLLATLDVDVEVLKRGRRTLVRPCLDWSERRDHVAGALGAALTTALIDRRWLVRTDGSRALRLTARGRDGLQQTLSLEAPPAP